MKRTLLIGLVMSFLASSALATYVIVMKDGTRYRAIDKWKVRGGRAIVTLESGATIQFDPNLIDLKGTDEANKLGYGDAKLIAVESKKSGGTIESKAAPLGSVTSLRKLPTGNARDANAESNSDSSLPSGPPLLGPDVARMFSKAYDNVGLFDAKIKPQAGYRLRVELTADNEDQVFKAISATSYVMTHIPDMRIDLVELFMVTLNGGSAGRFHITPSDAGQLNEKKLTWQDYYLANVIF